MKFKRTMLIENENIPMELEELKQSMNEVISDMLYRDEEELKLYEIDKEYSKTVDIEVIIKVREK